MKTLKHLFTALLLMVATVAMAHDFEVGGIYYRILSEEEKTVEVTFRGNSSSSYSYTGSVDIPSMVTYNNVAYSVTSIGYIAFRDCTSFTSIKIPNSVTSIGASAFYGCTSLTSVTIPNSVTSIEDSAFNGCTELTSIEIPNSVTSIGYNAFYGTAWLNNQSDEVIYAGKVLYKYKGTISENTSITINEGTLGIADYAFNDCTSLTSVTIPNSVTNIGYSAFYKCI